MRRFSVQDLQCGIPAAVREVAFGGYAPDAARPGVSFWAYLRGAGAGYGEVRPGNLFAQRGLVMRLGWSWGNGTMTRCAKFVRIRRGRWPRWN